MTAGPAIGRYHDLTVVGRGGSAIVYRGRSPELGEVAIKVLASPSREATERFAREARLLRELGAVPGVVPVLEVGETPSGPYVVMPFLDGGTLRDRLEKGPLGVAESVALVRSVAATLGRAHRMGVVHRDVKPENILFARGRPEEPLVADLGLAKHFVSSGEASVALSRTGELRGTPAYMSPEQARDAKHATPASDVFALGAVLFECLAGHPPFEGSSIVAVLAAVMAGSVPAPSESRAEVPRWLDAVVKRALAAAPEERFPDGAALESALARSASGAAPRSLRPVLGVALALLVVAAAALVVARQNTEASAPAAPSVPAPDPRAPAARPHPPTAPATPAPAPVSSEALALARAKIVDLSQELGPIGLTATPEVVTAAAKRARDALAKVAHADRTTLDSLLAPLVVALRAVVVASPLSWRDAAPKLRDVLASTLEPIPADRLPPELALEQLLVEAQGNSTQVPREALAVEIVERAHRIAGDASLRYVALRFASAVMARTPFRAWQGKAPAIAHRLVALDEEAEALLATLPAEDRELLRDFTTFALEIRRDTHLHLARDGPEAETPRHVEEAVRAGLAAAEIMGGSRGARVSQALRAMLELLPPDDPRIAELVAKHRSEIEAHVLSVEVVRTVEKNPARAIEIARKRRDAHAELPVDAYNLLAIEVNALIDAGRTEEARELFPVVEREYSELGGFGALVPPLMPVQIAERLRGSR